jgi:dTDP-4-dehydrorhamnose reductase
MRVLIIGSTGQLAQDLLKVFGADAVGLTHQELEVIDEANVARVLQSVKPEWVLNTAAFLRVDDCESNPGLAFAVNAVGALNVARAALAVGAGVVYFSTDYVFGGNERQPLRPYSESDRPQPLNVYGASKLAGEHLVMQSNPRHLVLRSTGLYGTSTSRKGWTFPELMLKKGREEGVVRVVDDQVLTPTYTADLANKVKELLDREATGLFHLTNSGACSWFDFTREVFRQAALDAQVLPISTAQSQRRARRPGYSVLTSSRLGEAGLETLRPWEQALHDYLRVKGMAGGTA